MFVKKKLRHRGKPKRKAVIKMVTPIHLTVEEMYRLYPHKWLLVNNPIHRDPDHRIIAGELLGVFDAREDAHKEGGKRKLRYRTVINSIQDEI